MEKTTRWSEIGFITNPDIATLIFMILQLIFKEEVGDKYRFHNLKEPDPFQA